MNCLVINSLVNRLSRRGDGNFVRSDGKTISFVYDHRNIASRPNVNHLFQFSLKTKSFPFRRTIPSGEKIINSRQPNRTTAAVRLCTYNTDIADMFARYTKSSYITQTCTLLSDSAFFGRSAIVRERSAIISKPSSFFILIVSNCGKQLYLKRSNSLFLNLKPVLRKHSSPKENFLPKTVVY